jgi:hypothetical protein
VAVGTLIKATRLLHDRALQGEKLGHAEIGFATDASYLIRSRQFSRGNRCRGAVTVDHGSRLLTRI